VEYVQVDGSRGEGGGQILRAAVAFSVIKGRPVRVEKIRAGRDVPGLKRQHVSTLRVLAEVFAGELEGAKEGSSVVTFAPAVQRLQTLSLDMGTAASITLVLQAVIPAVALTRSHLKLQLVGGTDVPWSPTYDYFERVVREAFKSVGINFTVSAERRGYYPRGGGRVTASVEPCTSVSAIGLAERGAIRGAKLVSRCGRLPRHVAERQLSSAAAALEGSGVSVVSSELSEEQADSPGSSILAYSVGSGVFLGADGIGARGRPAEDVGKDAGRRFADAAKSGAALDLNLADMLLPILALASKPSKVAIPAITPHLTSGLELARQFTRCEWSVEKRERDFVVTVEPNGG
jgi:RNA 3'-terminal phosphate cyclase (ATP)